MDDPGTRHALQNGTSDDGPNERNALEPLDYVDWVEAHTERVGELWSAAVRARSPQARGDVDALLQGFFDLLAAMLPASLGPYREEVEPLWLQASELFGSVAAKRGLAAGEAVEEFQMVREVLIRALYADPPGGTPGPAPVPLRDLLRMNRVIDQGVSHAAVGHADALFFALFQGSGVPQQLDLEVTREVAAQLTAIDEEFREVMSPRGV